DAKKYVTDPQPPFGAPSGRDPFDTHTRFAVLHARDTPGGLVLERGGSHAEIGIPVVDPVLRVGEEVTDDLRGNEEPDALQLLVVLERDADDSTLLDAGAPAIAAVDGCVCPDRQMPIDRGMDVELVVDPRHNTSRRRDLIATAGISIGLDTRPQ